MNFQTGNLGANAQNISGVEFDVTHGVRAERRQGAFQTWHSGLPLRWHAGGPEMSRSDSRQVQLALKAVFDRVMAAAAIFALLPLIVFVAIAIKATSRGPVFFKQLREGKDGRLFRAYKFRSMRTDLEDPTGLAQTVEGDTRVTRVGAFLRRTSIDELPQLFNVLRGDMSIVGPRPHVPGMLAAGQRYDRVVPYYHQRSAVLPGITGWAQCNGLRGSTSNPERAIARIEHDLAYIQNYSLLLDLKIILLTLRNEFLVGNGN